DLAADECRAAGGDPTLSRSAGADPAGASRRTPQSGPQHRAARHDAESAEHRRDAGGIDRLDAADRYRQATSEGATMTSRTLLVLTAALLVLALVAVWGQRGSAP